MGKSNNCGNGGVPQSTVDGSQAVVAGVVSPVRMAAAILNGEGEMRGLLIFLFATLASVGAAADVVTHCGASKGYGYYFQGPLVPPDHAGWTEDGISNGSIDLLRSGDQYDIVFKDVRGTYGMRESGFRVVVVQQSAGHTVILAVHPVTRVMEHYMFSLSPSGDGQVAWGSIKAGGVPIAKSSLVTARCSAPR